MFGTNKLDHDYTQAVHPARLNADQIGRALGGKRSGRQWLCRCPAHDDSSPSLLIFDGHTNVQFRCLAGCDPLEVIAALCARGLWEGSRSSRRSEDNHEATRAADTRADQVRNKMLALQLWEQAVDPRGTPAEDYLRGRGLVLPASCALSVLRYHPRCTKSGDTAPALLELMRNPVTFEPAAINRLFLDEDPDTGLIVKTKGMMLGGSGAMMITSRHDTFWDCLSYCPQLAICEGLETGLALLNAGQRCVWALGSAGAIARFPVIFGVGHLNIFADNDEQNLDTGFVAAVDCAKRWNASSHQSASIHMPTEAGKDFADLFRAGA